MTEEKQISNNQAVDGIIHLTNRIIGILVTIVVIALLAFLLLIGVYLFALINPGNQIIRPDTAAQIERFMLAFWDKLIPIGERVLRVVAPIIIMLLAIVGLRFLSKFDQGKFSISKLASDLPSAIALLIIATICLLPLSGLGIPDVLNNIAMVVVGFYFGKRKNIDTKEE